MVRRPLGSTGNLVSPLGFGAFKIGRNVGVKYAQSYDLPDDRAVADLLQGVLDLGINLIDTAPAYGLSEERIGAAIAHRRSKYVLATKVGETFSTSGGGHSAFDFTAAGTRSTVERSLNRLRTDTIDIVSIHSDGNDLAIINETGVVAGLAKLRDEGKLRWIGFSGKTPEGAAAAIEFADVVMVEYHVNDRSHEEAIAAAHRAGVGVLVKKGLASGRLAPQEAIPFVLSNPGVSCMVIGGLDLAHVRENLHVAESVGV